jgi:CubicO group peptidase (beta-lactamase class C family)
MRLAVPIAPVVAILACSAGTSTATGVSGGTTTLVVQVGGLPNGVNAAVQISGPGGYAQTVNATTTLARIAAGSYQFALGIVHQGDTAWYPDVTSDSLTVAGPAGATFRVYYGPLPVTGAYVPELVPFDSAMFAYMSARDIPAGAIAVSHGGITYMERGFGWLDPARTEPVPPNALFRLASITKPLTYEAIESLIAAGKVTASTAVYPLLGITPLPGAVVDPRIYTITVQNLIDHKGGWDDSVPGVPDWVFESRYVAQQMGLTTPPTKYQLAQYMMGQPLQHNPGTVYAYSNFGYSLLGLVIEHVSGEPYFTYLEQAILDPIGASDVHLAASLLSAQSSREPYYSDPGTNCSVFSIATCVTVPEAYGGFYIEAFDSFGGLDASAPTLLTFLQHYYIDGPAVQQGYVWNATFYGSLPGTSTMVRQLPDGSDIVTLFDQRTDPSGLNYDQQPIFDPVEGAISWPAAPAGLRVAGRDARILPLSDRGQ